MVMNRIIGFDAHPFDEAGTPTDQRRSAGGAVERAPWEVLLLDQDAGMRGPLQLVVSEMQVDQRPLQLFEAHSVSEARRWLSVHPGVALVVLGAEAETEPAALELVHHLRQELANRRVQILVVGTEPGYAPQREVIIEHQIDGYRPQSELTADRLFVAVFGALRAFHAQLQVKRQHESLERVADELRERAGRLRAVIESAPDAIVVVDVHGLVTGWNSGARELFGCTGREMEGRALAIPKNGRRRRGAGNRPLTDLDLDELPGLAGKRREVQGLRQDGQSVAVELAVGKWRSACGLNYSVIMRDFSDRKRHDDEILKLAFQDALTQLPNRRLLLDRLERTIARCQRSSCLGAVLVVDLDDFKSLNDIHGHDMGDIVLVEAGRRMKRCIRSLDTVGRLGGDEFLVVLGELSVDPNRAVSQAFRVAEEIRTAVARPYSLRSPQAGSTPVEYRCTATIGVSLVNAESDWDTLFSEADTAMYAAKEDGRDSVRLLDATRRLPTVENGARIIRLPRRGVKARTDEDRS